MVELHIDTDIGGDVDDLCAVAMALGWPGVRLASISTVHDLDGTRAALAERVVELAERVDEVIVVRGASSTLSGRGVPAVDEAERYWGYSPRPEGPSAYATVERLEWNAEFRNTIVAIGPFTNLAVLETLRPGLLAGTKLVVMGGWLDYAPDGFPQWGPEMDWNVQSDQVAARIVYERCDPIVVPLHITLQTYLTETHLTAVEDAGLLPALVARQARLYADQYGHRELGATSYGLPFDFLNFQHDPLAVAVALGWDGVTIEELQVTPVMQDGNLILAPGGDEPLRVVTGVNAEALADVWIDCLRRIH